MPGRAVRLLGSAGGAVSVQFVTAGASLIVQALAARSLGAHGYGNFALLIGVIGLITAVYTSWVGDTLTVYDRLDQRIRGGLLLSALGAVPLGALAGFSIALLMGLTTLAGAALFGLLVALWLINDTGRRIFTARMEFWRLAANDCGYLVVTLAAVAIGALFGLVSSVESLLGAMCLGLVAAITLAWLRLPRQEYGRAPLSVAAFREIAGFAWWRASQAGIRPAALLAARIMIVAFASAAALGEVEAARLLLAPALTFVAGAGVFVLGDYAKAEREGRPMRTRQALPACALMSLVALVLSLGGLVLLPWLGPLITSGNFDVDRVAVLGWGVYSVCFACTLPLACLATARKRSRMVFAVRGVESLIGLAVLAALLIVDPGRANLAPYCLGAGGLVSAALLWWLLRREDPAHGAAASEARPEQSHEDRTVTI